MGLSAMRLHPATIRPGSNAAKNNCLRSVLHTILITMQLDADTRPRGPTFLCVLRAGCSFCLRAAGWRRESSDKASIGLGWSGGAGRWVGELHPQTVDLQRMLRSCLLVFLERNPLRSRGTDEFWGQLQLYLMASSHW